MTDPLPDATPAAIVTTFAAASVRSLAWEGDVLVDWVGGGTRWTLQGERADSSLLLAFSFDMAQSLPGSGYSVIYKRLGTKGVVFKDGRVLREVDRSYYFAEDYEYPVALFRLPSGRPAIVHCPEDYNRLRIDDLETGEVLASASQAAVDIFHSRLSVSPDGRWLASAGWMWHPVDDVALYDLHAALADGTTFDGISRELGVLTERGNAAGFDARSRLLVTADMTGFGDEDAGIPDSSQLLRLAASEPSPAERWPLACDSAFMAVGDAHLLMLAGHPRLLSIATGRQVAAWPDIATIVPSSALQPDNVAFTPMACDVMRARIAFAHEDKITVLQFQV